MTSSTVAGIDLVELASRVEAATGPDRKIDALIADATGWWAAERERLGPFAPTVLEAAAFTASLDAAMALVPERQASECLNDAVETLGLAGWSGRWRDALPRFLTATALRARAPLIEEERS